MKKLKCNLEVISETFSVTYVSQNAYTVNPRFFVCVGNSEKEPRVEASDSSPTAIFHVHSPTAVSSFQ
jgi:hypothetical protein